MNNSIALDDAHASPARLPWAERKLGRLAQWFAYAGGTAFLLLLVMSLVSIIGRKLWATPINGDMELMEMGAAVAIAAFLPYCAINDDHIKVEAFTSWASPGAKRWLDASAYALFTVVAGLLTWRTGLQMFETHINMDSSALLAVPLWWALAGIVPSLVLLTLCTAWRCYSMLTSQERSV
ncbi:TRAP transporter small permease [Pseudomonas sp. LRF_L74]|uniref:TRAP transporter small permease n=1 Tax=Pseudomonas sp. LRF_L74 TaxID=3369422 RepID=UPI003F5E8C1C